MTEGEEHITNSNAKLIWEKIKPYLPGIALWYVKRFPKTKLAMIIQIFFEILDKHDKDLQEYRELNP